MHAITTKRSILLQIGKFSSHPYPHQRHVALHSPRRNSHGPGGCLLALARRRWARNLPCQCRRIPSHVGRAGGQGGVSVVLTKRCIAPSYYCCVIPQLQLHRTSRMKEKRNVFCDLDIRSTRRKEAGTGRCKAPAAPPRLFSRCTLEQEAKWPAQGLSLVHRPEAQRPASMKYQFACIFYEGMINVEASWPAVVAISHLLFERAALQHNRGRKSTKSSTHMWNSCFNVWPTFEVYLCHSISGHMTSIDFHTPSCHLA